MILGDSDIRFFLDTGHIDVEPKPRDRDIQPASLELHIAEEVWLAPGEFMLSHTLEVVTLGASVAAHLSGKSSIGRMGLQVHCTAGWIDPGFSGQIVLELFNQSQKELWIEAKVPIGQLVFHMLRSPALRPYGHPDLGSHYQHQRGNIPSYLDTTSPVPLSAAEDHK